MRAFKFLNLAMLSLLVASSAALYAQDEKPQEEKPRQEEPRPEPKQEEAKPNQQDEAKPSKPGKQEQDKQQQKEQKQEQKQQEKQSREEMKSGRQESAQQQGHSRPAGKSAHIPDDRFRAQFGRSHTFAVQRTVIVEGQPRFQYGGYSFVLIDAWPEDWAYTDDCYIDYIDGDYFLFDLLHPGVRIALFVSM